ncbi:MAG: electron transfer flavoprotein subunit beta/FixA family protein [Chloroflexota bacterium]|nr:electron transfer flavoprotein subunit beta/FixA family protein [Chloroflexota bacterium]MDQ5864566.1 electron transfer flavoprotein subunit beta/FixA family protein [Chloroflexota bacterium]
MNIVICMKSVPDTTAEKRLLPDGTLDRASVAAVINPWDEYAIEEALRIRESGAATGEIVLLCMGPENSTETIRKGLAMGADRAVLVSDPALHGSDMWATARVLAAALKTLQFDIVMFGSQSTDAGGGIIYNAVAEMLGLPAVTWINEVSVQGGKVRGKRGSDVGYDVVEAPVPCVVSVTQTANEPRYPSLPGIMKAKKKEIANHNVASLGIDASEVGLSGARSQVTGTERPQTARANQVLKAEDPAATAAAIADFLESKKLI